MSWKDRNAASDSADWRALFEYIMKINIGRIMRFYLGPMYIYVGHLFQEKRRYCKAKETANWVLDNRRVCALKWISSWTQTEAINLHPANNWMLLHVLYRTEMELYVFILLADVSFIIIRLAFVALCHQINPVGYLVLLLLKLLTKYTIQSTDCTSLAL